VATLLSFRDQPYRRAADGAHGAGGRRRGRRGADLVVPVPVGTVVRLPDGAVLADLAAAGDRVVVAAGGRGGKGNARFLANRRRAPAFAEQGERGEERWLELELRLVADVALVGFPNAGKSTLLSRLSAARPRIADYPFTTLEPHLGVVRAPGGRGEEGEEMVIADVPGLVDGAAEGRGLGHRFLRHVERARVLVVLADLSPSAPLPPREQVRVLLAELGRYDPALVGRPRLVAGSRADLRPLGERPELDDYGGHLVVSGATGEGLAELVRRMATLVGEARAASAAPIRAPVVHRPLSEGIDVRREGASFVVVGRAAERAVALSDLTAPDARLLVARRLRRLGVDRALARAGAREGDLVRIGGISFEYEPEP